MAARKLSGGVQGLREFVEDIRNACAWQAIDPQAPKADRVISEAKAQSYGLMAALLTRLPRCRA